MIENNTQKAPSSEQVGNIEVTVYLQSDCSTALVIAVKSNFVYITLYTCISAKYISINFREN